MSSVNAQITAAERRWQQAWPQALACWSKYTRLCDPIWCRTPAAAKRYTLLQANPALSIQPVVLGARAPVQLGSDLTDNPESVAIIRAVTNLCKDLGMVTVAEGVETAEHAAILTELGCETAQGYHFGRPMSAADARAVFHTDQRRANYG